MDLPLDSINSTVRALNSGVKPLRSRRGIASTFRGKITRRAESRVAVLVERGEAPHDAEVVSMAGGVVRHRAELDQDAWAEQSQKGLAVLRRYARSPREPLSPEALDEAAIVEERLRQVGPAGGGRVLVEGWRTAQALEHIARAVRRLAESTDDANEAFSDG